MRNAVLRNQSEVITVLVAVVDGVAREKAGAIVFVRGDGTHTGVRCSPAHAAVLRLAEVDIRHVAESGRVVAGVVKCHIDIAGYWVRREPREEAIYGKGQPVSHRRGSRPACTAVVGKRRHDVRGSLPGAVHPGAVDAAPMRAGGAIGRASGIEQCAAKGLRRWQCLEAQRLAGNHMRRAPGVAAVKGSVEGDGAGGIVVPRDIDLASRPNEGHCADRPAGTGRIVHATDAEAGPMVRGSRYAD